MNEGNEYLSPANISYKVNSLYFQLQLTNRTNLKLFILPKLDGSILSYCTADNLSTLHINQKCTVLDAKVGSNICNNMY